MRIITIQALTVLALGAALAGSSPAIAQLSDISPHGSGYGDRDAQREDFSPIDDLDPEVTTAPLTGTIEVTFDVTIKSTIAAGSTLYCVLELGATTNNSTTSSHMAWGESNLKTQSISGSSATCTVEIPYSWLIPPSSKTVNNKLIGVYTIGALTGVVTKAKVRDLRSSSHEFLNTKTLPANGAITKYTVDVTI